MRIDIITIFPKMVENMFNFSIVKKAKDSGVAEINVHNLRDYSLSPNKSVDDYPYGGESGMVLQIEPIDRCIGYLKTKMDYDEVIYLTPDGEKFNQKIANYYSLKTKLILLCGHYKGVDQRVREHLITKEISVGDFVLTGGELASGIVVDSIVRLLPNAMGDSSSALTDTFQDDLFTPPIYTRPKIYKGFEVPKILLSGNRKLIENWKDDWIEKKSEK